jgi:hypothetical protein
MLSSPSRSVEDETDEIVAAAKLRLNKIQSKKEKLNEKKKKKHLNNKTAILNFSLPNGTPSDLLNKSEENNEDSDTSSSCATTELGSEDDNDGGEGEFGNAYDFYELIEGSDSAKKLPLSKIALEHLFGSRARIKRSKSLDSSLDKSSKQMFYSRDDSELYMDKATLTGNSSIFKSNFFAANALFFLFT